MAKKFRRLGGGASGFALTQLEHIVEAVRRGLDLIDLAGIPDNLATWRSLLSRLDTPELYVIAPILGVGIILYAFWPDISKNLGLRRLNHELEAAWLTAPSSGKLAAKLILARNTVEDAEHILEVYGAQPRMLDELYVRLAWAEFLLKHNDRRFAEAQLDVGWLSAEPGQDFNEAKNYLFPTGLPSPSSA